MKGKSRTLRSLGQAGAGVGADVMKKGMNDWAKWRERVGGWQKHATSFEQKQTKQREGMEGQRLEKNEWWVLCAHVREGPAEEHTDVRREVSKKNQNQH